MPFFIYVTLLCATVCCVRHTGGAETDDQAEATATKAIICKPGDVLFNIAKKKCCSLSSSDSSAKRCITTSCSIKRIIVYDTRNLAPSAPRRWSIETLQMAPDFLRCSQILKVKHLKFRKQ